MSKLHNTETKSAAYRQYINYNVLVKTELKNPATFSYQINVPFTPDEMRVKYTSAMNLNPPGIAKIFTVWSSLTNQDLAAVMASNQVQPVDTVFQFNGRQTINGTYQFNILDTAGALSTTLNGVSFVMLLEFVKFV